MEEDDDADVQIIREKLASQKLPKESSSKRGRTNGKSNGQDGSIRLFMKAVEG